MSDSCVDLINLRELTDGDEELEIELFEEFIGASQSLLEELQASLGKDAHETWQKAAHALKGISLNLGAMRLGSIAKDAQESAADQEIKSTLLESITSEHAQVIAFLKQEHA